MNSDPTRDMTPEQLEMYEGLLAEGASSDYALSIIFFEGPDTFEEDEENGLRVIPIPSTSTVAEI